MGRSDVLALGCREGDDLLALGRPGDSTSIDEEHVARYGTPVLGHAAIHVGIALKDSPSLSISQPEVACASQIAVDLLDSIPVSRPRVCSKPGNGGDCEGDVGTSSKGSPVEGANSLTVGLIMHDCVLLRGGWCLLRREMSGRVHWCRQRLEFVKVVVS